MVEQKFQLWMLYPNRGWVMDSFHDSLAEAASRYKELFNDPETPCIENSYVVPVEVDD